MSKPHLVTFIALFLALTPVAQAQNDQKTVLGWVESVYIADLDTKLKGKLDTGAKTSSMRADVLKIIRPKKGERRRVVFQVEDTGGAVSTLERKLVRWVRIKSKQPNVFYRRPVVEMEFCLGGKRITSEVNLAPRKDFIYPILVGRNMLSEADIVVDAEHTFTSTTHCPISPTKSSKTED